MVSITFSCWIAGIRIFVMSLTISCVLVSKHIYIYMYMYIIHTCVLHIQNTYSNLTQTSVQNPAGQTSHLGQNLFFFSWCKNLHMFRWSHRFLPLARFVWGKVEAPRGSVWAPTRMPPWAKKRQGRLAARKLERVDFHGGKPRYFLEA